MKGHSPAALKAVEAPPVKEAGSGALGCGALGCRALGCGALGCWALGCGALGCGALGPCVALWSL